MSSKVKSSHAGKNLDFRKYCLIIVSLVLSAFGGFFNVQAQNGAWTKKADLPNPRGASALDSLSWLQIGTGVGYAMADSTLGEDVFIGIGGWTCTQELVTSWVTALYAAKLNMLGIRHLYSVSGPKDEGYQSREIGTLDLAHHILDLLQLHPASNQIIVAAHSSGAYVAHVLFQDLYDGAGIDSSHHTDGKVLYFVLDEPLGSYPAVELTNTSADRLGHIYGVYAVISSQNLYSYAPNQMIALGNSYGSRSSTVVIDASSSNCNATMCLHMTMINQKPYQSSWYDARDYGAINPEHPVQTAYLDVITGLYDDSQQPITAWLCQNYPNPFNPTTTIRYQIPSTNYITLKIIDVLGREVATLVNEEKPAGTYEVMWNAEGLPSGVYFYQLRLDNFTATKKLLLLK